MRIRTLAVFAIVLAAAFVQCGKDLKIDPSELRALSAAGGPDPASVTKGSEARTFRLKFQKERPELQRAAMTMKMKLAMSGAMDMNQDMDMNMDMLFENTVQSVDGEQATIRQVIRKFTVTPDLPGIDADGVQGAVLSTRMDARGKTLSTDVVEGGFAAQQMLGQMDQQMQFVQNVFPEGTLKPGESWSESSAVPIPNLPGANMNMDLKVTYRGDVDKDGRTLAVLDTAIDIKGDGTIDQMGAEGKFAALGRAQGVTLFDVERGLLVSSKVDMTMKMKAHIKAGGDSADMNLDLDVGLDVTDETDWKAAPPAERVVPEGTDLP